MNLMKAIVVAVSAAALAGCSIALDPIERWSSSKTSSTDKKEHAAVQPSAPPAAEPADAEE